MEIDDAMMIMEVAGNPVLEASNKDGAMKCYWLSEEWELVAACNASLGKARQRDSKGGSKGH